MYLSGTDLFHGLLHRLGTQVKNPKTHALEQVDILAGNGHHGIRLFWKRCGPPGSSAEIDQSVTHNHASPLAVRIEGRGHTQIPGSPVIIHIDILHGTGGIPNQMDETGTCPGFRIHSRLGRREKNGRIRLAV